MATFSLKNKGFVLTSIIIVIIVLAVFFIIVFFNKTLLFTNTHESQKDSRSVSSKSSPISIITNDMSIIQLMNDENEYENPEYATEWDILGDEQNETINFLGNGSSDILTVLDSASQNEIFSKDLPLRIDDWKMVDIDRDGKAELYIEGFKESIRKKELFKFSDEDFFSIFNLDTMKTLCKGMEAKIEKNRFTCSYSSGDNNLLCKGVSILPKKLFYGVKKGESPNKFLYAACDWRPVKKDNSWYIDVISTFKIKAGQYYFGPWTGNPPPPEAYTDFYCDIARLHVIFKYENSNFTPVETKLVMNYNANHVRNYKLLQNNDASFNGNIALGLNIFQVCKSLGIKLDEYGYVKGECNTIRFTGITLNSFYGDTVINIKVDSNKYKTKRGLKVGDSIETLKSLYGIPDQGFLEDNQVVYYSNGNNFYRKMYITLKNRKVARIEFDQMASD